MALGPAFAESQVLAAEDSVSLEPAERVFGNHGELKLTHPEYPVKCRAAPDAAGEGAWASVIHKTDASDC